MGITCILETNIVLVGRFWDFNFIFLITAHDVQLHPESTLTSTPAKKLKWQYIGLGLEIITVL